MKKEYIIPIFVPHLGCPNKCVFCNQTKITGKQKQVTAEEARKIIDEYLSNFKDKENKVEIAFFGGSFTAIDENIQNELLEVAYEYVKKGLADSIRISTRPDYITKDILLRSQTSSVQVHEMEKGKLPIRMIAPGRVFRSDEVDATHSPTFHQIEGLVIDKNITFADLKGTLQEFAKRLFGEETKVKFRPHHFQFTEPSAEMDVTCFKCGGKGCRFCKGSGWVEILGCGMVHPHVLE